MIQNDLEIAIRKYRCKDWRRLRIVFKLKIQAAQTDAIGPRKTVDEADWYIKTRNRIQRRLNRVMAAL